MGKKNKNIGSVFSSKTVSKELEYKVGYLLRKAGIANTLGCCKPGNLSFVEQVTQIASGNGGSGGQPDLTGVSLEDADFSNVPGEKLLEPLLDAVPDLAAATVLSLDTDLITGI